jgi:hypothetical protein
LPIDPASDFTDSNQLSGTSVVLYDYNIGGAIIIESDLSKKIFVRVNGLSGEVCNCSFSISYSL